MCSLCGVLGVDDHWSDAVARPGVYSRNEEPRERRAERTRRIRAANDVLRAYRLSLGDWHGRAYLLSTATGKTEVVENLAHLWPTAEALSGRLFDPLDPDLLARLEAAS
ncbi:hypothetical protein [Aurantimonas sp. Leaf443]|uniref:hypothetical protein n=1 Tax=Aurantimonas sp. Leaf443 TaxID=1736378 RepID=UPI0006FE523D|nr:hypothetical protein [Aurantimonas sp. Leaf443]KQT82812.1 hypothetical protein ASG48_15100 [Aurantimonas sp. Leaf443]